MAFPESSAKLTRFYTNNGHKQKSTCPTHLSWGTANQYSCLRSRCAYCCMEALALDTNVFFMALPTRRHRNLWDFCISLDTMRPETKKYKLILKAHHRNGAKVKTYTKPIKKWLILDQIWLAVNKVWCNNASIISRPAYEGQEAHYLKK